PRRNGGAPASANGRSHKARPVVTATHNTAIAYRSGAYRATWRCIRRPVIAAAAPASHRASGRVERRPHGIEERSASNRLFEKRDRAGLERAAARLLVRVSGPHDDRHTGAGAAEKLETAHAGHAHVEHHAADTIPGRCLQKGFGRVEGLDGKAHGHQ